MKIRLGSLLNDLNISLDTAKEILKKSEIKGDRKEFTLNTVVSEEEIQLISSYYQSLREKNNLKDKKKKNKPKGGKKPLNNHVTLKKTMTSSRSFDSCANYLIYNQKKIEILEDIKKELKRIFGSEDGLFKLPLFKTMVIKNIKVSYKYHYYSLNGHKVIIEHKCFATWLASIFSEAVNQEKITKADYRQIYRKYLSEPIQSTKKKYVKPKRRPWVSVVSVPFGGMNKKY